MLTQKRINDVRYPILILAAMKAGYKVVNTLRRH